MRRLASRGAAGKAFQVLALAVLMAVASAPAARAVEPDEILKNPVLEHRAQVIGEGLRCLVCQNESIENSSADLARDIRILVRKQLLEGKTNQQIMNFMVARYGEFVLLKPRFVPHNYVLWFAAPATLLLGIAAIFVAYRHRKKQDVAPKALTEDEKRRLEKFLEQA